MDASKRAYLEDRAREIRKSVVKAIAAAGQGHIGGALSVVDVLTALYYDIMKVDPSNPLMKDRDKLVLSKGHAGPALYATLAHRGFFPTDWLETLNQPGTNLPSHVDMLRTPGIDMTAGSLGQGISCAVGLAKGARIKGGDERVFVIIGDGESQEGSVWEASMAAAQYKLDNLIVFLDNNKLQIDGTVDDIMSLIDPVAEWEAFGFNTYRIDGHDVAAVGDTTREAVAVNNGKPTMIVLDTVKGKGISFIEAAGAANHSMPITDDMVERAVAELDGKGVLS
jgi:transketolase